MTTTINISLPVQLKQQAQELIDEGHFASFSDAVRTALRQLLAESKIERMHREALEDHKNGKSFVAKSTKDIEDHLDSLV